MMKSNILIEFVFQLARENEYESIASATPSLNDGDWVEIQQLLTFQGIAPVIYSRILEHHYELLLPASFVLSLRDIYINNAARNLYLQKQLGEILTVIGSNQIQVVLLKGVLYYKKFYKNPACRTMTDIDLLIKQEQINAILNIFEGLGYKLQKKLWEGPGHHLPQLRQAGSPFPVELHWQLTPPSRTTPLSNEVVWKEVLPGTFFGQPCLEISPELALFHACQHTAYQHLFTNAPRTLFDIDAIIRNCPQPVDWKKFWELVNYTHSIDGITMLLKLTLELLGTPLDNIVNQHISDAHIPEGIQTTIYESMVSGEEMPDTPSQGFFTQVAWWFGKSRKFFGSAKRIKEEPSMGSSSAAGHQPPSSIHRISYLIKANVNTVFKQLKIDRGQTKIKTSRELRRWLKIS